MILGRVIGQVWATRKAEGLEGQKLLVIKPLTWYLPDHDTDNFLAVDPVGARVGEDVIVCMGLMARKSLGGTNYPIEAAVSAIVDGVEIFDDGDGPAFEFRPGHEPGVLRSGRLG